MPSPADAGPHADMIATMSETTVTRLCLNRRHRGRSRVEYDGGEARASEHGGHDDAEPTTFRRPLPKTGQLSLF